MQDRSNGSTLIRVPRLRLPPGWSKPSTDVWFVVPVGYPGAMPDCFWAEPDLRLADGAQPANSGQQAVGGTGPEVGLWFSWHLQRWNPSTDAIVSYVHFIESRFRRVS
jgi:hypothetical protein